MNPKPVIGLVGGIGSGKSFVAGLMAARGGRVISADPIAHAALRDPAIRARVVASFGPDCLGPDGEIDRKTLGAAVFADDRRRRQLEAIVHPWVGDRVAGLIEEAGADPAVRFVALDAPVMLEAGWNNVCDRLVYLDVPRDVQLARLAARGWSAEQIAAREQAQLPLAEKARRSDAVIDNGGPADQTARAVDELLKPRWKLI